jgi:hypothetical protein
MSKPELGSAPIQTEFAETMQAAAAALDEVFNPGLHGRDRTIGFVLMVYPFGSKDGRCNYISNGAAREDMVKMLREQANRFDKGTM